MDCRLACFQRGVPFSKVTKHYRKVKHCEQDMFHALKPDQTIAGGGAHKAKPSA